MRRLSILKRQLTLRNYSLHNTWRLLAVDSTTNYSSPSPDLYGYGRFLHDEYPIPEGWVSDSLLAAYSCFSYTFPHVLRLTLLIFDIFFKGEDIGLLVDIGIDNSVSVQDGQICFKNCIYNICVSYRPRSIWILHGDTPTRGARLFV